jgi:hypothetical protein
MNYFFAAVVLILTPVLFIALTIVFWTDYIPSVCKNFKRKHLRFNSSLRRTQPSPLRLTSIWAILLAALFSTNEFSATYEFTEISFWWIFSNALWLTAACLCLGQVYDLTASKLTKFSILILPFISIYVWWIRAESASELNAIFSIPGDDLNIALAALTFLYALAAVASFFLILALITEIFVLFFGQDKIAHFINGLALLISLGFLSNLSIIPLSGIARDYAVYVAIRYDFNSQLVCKNTNVESNTVYRFLSENRDLVIKVVHKPFSLATIKQRQLEIKKNPRETPRTKYMQSIEVLPCKH